MAKAKGMIVYIESGLKSAPIDMKAAFYSNSPSSSSQLPSFKTILNFIF
ncbi:hypothetical protein J2799_000865 [Chryseobacterium vietnamense]|nr:hypothetical protein [Chryseobacterium vietnamense]MDR6486380.1 hypothetical protein [Chryseobacterium vietnamense]